MINVENISFRYPGSSSYIINDLSCTFRMGEVTAVTGRNGCGKTTLARILTGVLRPDSGRVVISGGAPGDEKDIKDMSLCAIGRVIGFVYQDPTRQLFCETVYDEIAYGLRKRKLSGGGDITEEETDRRVRQAMEYFRLSEKADEYPGTMSQGEKQRVMLAAVTALDTQYIVLDEPTSGLDMEGCERLGELMRDMSARGTGVIMISHERSFIDRYADREIRADKINITENASCHPCSDKCGKEKGQGRDDNDNGDKAASGAERGYIRRNRLGTLDARARMYASLCIVMISVFSRDPACLLCVTALTAALVGAGGAGLMNALYRVRAMAGLAASLFILQCVFVRSGDALFTVKGAALITSDGLAMAAVSSLRLMILAFTALIMAAGDMRSCLAALSQMHLPYDIVFMVMAALKFLPFLKEECVDVMNASKMRGASFDDMNAAERARLYLRLTVPVTAGAIRRAEHMNIAMAARGFRAYEKRTRLFCVRMHTYDWIFMAMVSIAVLLILYIFYM